ncbi:MAG: tetratricopeptide repeat protein [Sulfurimonas sp.]
MKNSNKIFAEAVKKHQENKLDEAEIMYEQILKIDPKHAATLHALGLLLTSKKEYKRATQLIKKAISLKAHEVYYHNLGALFGRQGKNQNAVEMYEKAIKLNPRYAEAYYSLGVTLKDLGKTDDAINMFEKTIVLNPMHAECYNNLGVVLQEKGNIEDAMLMLTKVIELNPKHAVAYNNLGVIFQESHKTQDAISMFAKAIELDPSIATAYNNIGMIYTDFARIEDALSMYEKAIELDPGYSDAYWNKAISLLTLGRFEDGFKLYEWRWETKYKSIKEKYIKPLWLGEESLQDKTILIHSEQGYGDTIQFCRYLDMVADLGAHIIFEVEEALLPLMQQLTAVKEFITKGSVLPEFDYHCPLLSLPLAFKTSLETIPSFEKYLYADMQKVAVWQNRLGEKKEPRVGIVWSGSKTHKNDFNRSIELQKLLKVLPKEYQYFSLQKDLRENDAEILEVFNIKHYAEELQNFADTAALISCMDFVISVDTSIAHLAGSLGKETLILLPFSADWRWLQDREDTPWYPSVTLLRQKSINNWEDVLSLLSYLEKT